jgi:polyisoprenoid-binding protein YceI
VNLRVASKAMRVRDPKVSDHDRARIQQAMEGPAVLDVVRYPEIRFRSTAIEKSGAERWTVHGMLELHGQSHSIGFTVRREGRFYRGTATVRQTEFGIKPIRLGGGTVRVKDEVRVDFDIALGS